MHTRLFHHRCSRYGLLIGILSISSLQAADLPWQNTNFIESGNIALLVNYHDYLYAAGSNQAGQGTSWLYGNQQWRKIYQAKDSSMVADTAIVTCQLQW